MIEILELWQIFDDLFIKQKLSCGYNLIKRIPVEVHCVEKKSFVFSPFVFHSHISSVNYFFMGELSL